MREFRFRAWDMDKNEMVYGNEGIFESSWEGVTGTPAYLVNKILSNDIIGGTIFHWMQFTGLLDKNGKEIWEGDIVRMHNSMGIFYSAEVRTVDGCSEVCVPRLQWRDYLKCYTCNHAVEVIGNVHENPGLL